MMMQHTADVWVSDSNDIDGEPYYPFARIVLTSPDDSTPLGAWGHESTSERIVPHTALFPLDVQTTWFGTKTMIGGLPVGITKKNMLAGWYEAVSVKLEFRTLNMLRLHAGMVFPIQDEHFIILGFRRANGCTLVYLFPVSGLVRQGSGHGLVMERMTQFLTSISSVLHNMHAGRLQNCFRMITETEAKRLKSIVCDVSGAFTTETKGLPSITQFFNCNISLKRKIPESIQADIPNPPSKDPNATPTRGRKRVHQTHELPSTPSNAPSSSEALDVTSGANRELTPREILKAMLVADLDKLAFKPLCIIHCMVGVAAAHPSSSLRKSSTDWVALWSAAATAVRGQRLESCVPPMRPLSDSISRNPVRLTREGQKASLSMLRVPSILTVLLLQTSAP